MKAKYFALLAIVFLLLSSCMKESTKTLYARQETNIETLVAAQQKANENYTVTTRDGSTRLTLAAGEGDELTDDKIISFYYAGYVLTGSSLPAASALFATNSEEVATAAKWDLTKADETGADVSGDASADASEDAAAEEVEEEPDPRYEILTVRLSALSVHFSILTAHLPVVLTYLPVLSAPLRVLPVHRPPDAL